MKRKGGGSVQATDIWLRTTGATFAPEGGIASAAHLTNYTVDYRIWGEGEPIVLVPGLAGGMGLLGPLARLLASRHKVICYQLRGEDNCFAIRRPFDLQDLVLDLREFLDSLGLETPTLFGVSFGGAIGLEFAARYPGRIGNLIVQGAGSRFMPGMLQQIAGTVLNRFPLPFDNPFVNQFFNLLFGRPEQAGPLLDFVTQQIWSTDQSVMAHRFQLIESFNMRDKLPAVRVPALVLAGERDVLVPQRNLRELCNGLPNGQFVRVPQAGHLAFVTHAEQVAERVGAFLSR
jgi:pimeloyl-ACP methyl ester carboxylesterase